jgi:hypothetical protein
MLNNVFIIIILSITFLCLFQFIATFINYSNVPIVEPMDPNENIVFPEANLVDASNLEMRINHLDSVIVELNAIRDSVSSSKNILKLTSSEKKAPAQDVKRSEDNSRTTSYTGIDTSELFDITISGEPLAQTIHIDVPVGKRGPDGNVGKRGPKGKKGEPGDVGPVGYCGLSIC